MSNNKGNRSLKDFAGEIRRYYNALRIFRFFINHPYVYLPLIRNSIFPDSKGEKFRKPRNIVLKLTSDCNARCIFCYARREPKNNTESLGLKEWKDVIRQAKDMGCYTVTLSGGEPTLVSYLLELVSFSRKMGMLVFTTTNGISVTENMLRDLESSGLCALNWSIHGPEESHDSFVGIKGSFMATLRMGEYCARHTKLICIVNHVLTKESIRNNWYSLIWDQMHELGFRALNLLPVCMSAPDKSCLLDNKDLEVYDSLLKKEYVLSDTKNYIKPLCPAARDDLLVNNFGYVQPCPFIPISFGNIKERKLSDIFSAMQKHSIFNEEKNICIAARDNVFIDNYLMPVFNRNSLPSDIKEVYPA